MCRKGKKEREGGTEEGKNAYRKEGGMWERK